MKMHKLLIVAMLLVAACSNDITGIKEHDVAKSESRIFDKPVLLRNGVLMASQKKNPSTASTVSFGYSQIWLGQNNVFVSDNLRATVNIYTISSYSDILYIKGFGFEIPAGATIDGIEVAIERRSTPTNLNFCITVLQNVPGAVSDDTESNWSNTDTIALVGGPTSKWGASPTVAQVNSSDFGVGLIVGSNFAPAVLEIDNVYITVYYTDSGTTVVETQTITLSMSQSDNELTGNRIEESQTIELSVNQTETELLDIVESQTIALEVFDIAGSNFETAGIRCVSDDNDIFVQDIDIEQLTETWSKNYQINKYQDGHSSIYHLGEWLKKWILVIKNTGETIQFAEALRNDVNNIRFFPVYLYDKSTFYKVRVDNRIPLYYASGYGDAEEFLKIVFYEVT